MTPTSRIHIAGHREMVEADYTAARRDSLVKLAGFQAYDYNE